MTKVDIENRSVTEKKAASARLAAEMRELNRRALRLFILSTSEDEARQLWLIVNASARISIRAGRGAS